MKLKRNVESLLSSNVRASTIAELNQLNRKKPKIDLRGFGTSLFDMVLKEDGRLFNKLSCFGTSLFDMVLKVCDLIDKFDIGFGTSLFDMVLKDWWDYRTQGMDFGTSLFDTVLKVEFLLLL